MPLTGHVDSTSDPTRPLAAMRALLAQQLAAMALRTAGRRRCSAQCHGRARGRGKRGRKLPPDEESAPPELWEPLGSAPSRALPTPGLELAHRPDDAWQLSRRSAVAASPFLAMARSGVVRMTSRQRGEAQSSVFVAAA